MPPPPSVLLQSSFSLPSVLFTYLFPTNVSFSVITLFAPHCFSCLLHLVISFWRLQCLYDIFLCFSDAFCLFQRLSVCLWQSWPDSKEGFWSFYFFTDTSVARSNENLPKFTSQCTLTESTKWDLPLSFQLHGINVEWRERSRCRSSSYHSLKISSFCPTLKLW